MTSIIKVHGLSGLGDESPPAAILQVDEFRFLLDAGWDERLEAPYVKDLKKYAPSSPSRTSCLHLYCLIALPNTKMEFLHCKRQPQ